LNPKTELKEIDGKFSMLQREKTQLEKRISEITVEIFRLQGEVRVLKRQEAEERTEKKGEEKK
jgi:DNA repair exonuclease SbcCD ATPase subunit